MSDNIVDNNDFLSREQLANLLQVSKAQIAIWEREGLPAMKLSHKVVRYNYDLVKEWLINKKSS